jgi:hypothetical protein
VLGAAKAKGERVGENPARWKDNLDGLLPPQKKSGGHHKALHYRKVPAFMHELSKSTDVAEAALSFTVQTVARSSEARLAKRLARCGGARPKLNLGFFKWVLWVWHWLSAEWLFSSVD